MQSSSSTPLAPFPAHSSSRQQRPAFHYTNTSAHTPNLHPGSHISQSSEWPNEKARPLDDGVRRARSVERIRAPIPPQHQSSMSVDGRSRSPSSHVLALHSHPPPTRTPLPRYPYPVRSPHPQELRIGGAGCSCDMPDSLKPWIPMLIWALSSLAFLVAITYYKTEVFTGVLISTVAFQANAAQAWTNCLDGYKARDTKDSLYCSF